MNRFAYCIAAVPCLAAYAMAADMPLKSPPAVSAWSWTGFYAGVSAGGRVADNDWTSTNLFPSIPGTIQSGPSGGSIDSAAARFGGYFGYNWMLSPAWLVGVESDIGWANNSKTVVPAPGTAGLSLGGCGAVACTGQPTATVKENWDGSLRARLGTFVATDTLLYVTGGFAWQRVTIASICGPNGLPTEFCLLNNNDSASSTMTGWTAGGGVEERIFGNWLARIDYRYAEFGTLSHQFFPTSFGPGFDDRYTGNVKPRTHTFGVGLAYKF